MNRLLEELAGTPVAGRMLERAQRGINLFVPAAQRALEDHPRLERWARRVKQEVAPPGPSDPPLRTAWDSPRFCELVCRRLGVPNLAAIGDPMLAMHRDFSMSTIERGRQAVEELRRFAPLEGKSCLDVGCAYGGFLVALRGAGAREALGVDVSDQLLECARALLRDSHLPASVYRMDLLEGRLARRLGRFDVVTCSDVIEHVVDPALGLRELVSLLEPEGVLFLQIPNRHYVGFLASDGHFCQYGITALPKRKADEYYRQVFGGQHDVTYRSLGFYLANLGRLGAEAHVTNSPPEDLDAALAAMSDAFRKAVDAGEAASPKASPDLVAEARRRIARLAATFERERSRYEHLQRRGRAQAEALGRKLVLRLGVDFWRLMVRRAPSRRRLRGR